MFVYFKKGKLNAGKIYLCYILKEDEMLVYTYMFMYFKKERNAGENI